MKKIAIAFAAAATLALASCTTTMVSPICATSNDVGKKVGEASVKYLFGYIPMGNNLDAGIATAAKNGGVKKISTVDKKIKSGLLFTTVSTVVTGE